MDEKMQKRINQMKKQVLDFFNITCKNKYNVTKKAVDKIVDVWYMQKKDLIEVLSKHPNWDEDKFMIVFDRDYLRPFNKNGFFDFLNFLTDRCMSEKKYDAYNRLIYIKMGYKPSQFLTKEQEIKFHEAFNELGSIREGQKISRVINKVANFLGLDKTAEYNIRYPIFADLMNPMSIPRHTILSLHPIDYLWMSNGGTWTSCHNVYDLTSDGISGCYSAGTLSYMLDDVSMIMYTVDNKYKGRDFEMEFKLQRQVFAYNKGLLMQSRMYPQDLDRTGDEMYNDIRGWVQEVISTALDVPNSWGLERAYKNQKIFSGIGNLGYSDWQYERYAATLSTLKNYKTAKNIVIGTTPICPRCGGSVTDTHSILCKANYCVSYEEVCEEREEVDF